MEKKNLLEDKFMTSAKFSQEVEKIAVSNEDMNYIDSVLHLCEYIQNSHVFHKVYYDSHCYSRTKVMNQLRMLEERVKSNGNSIHFLP